MPPTLDYYVYDRDVERYEDEIGDLIGNLPQLARVASRRVAWKVAAAWRTHMELPASHALPDWLQAVLEAEAPD